MMRRWASARESRTTRVTFPGANRARRPAPCSTSSAEISSPIIDESHASIPQIGGMFEGDRSRKTTLVEHGFRLPSALDNRPLQFDEFMARYRQSSTSARRRPGSRSTTAASATPATSPTKTRRVGTTEARRPVRASPAAPAGREVRCHHPGKDLIVEQIIRPTGLLDPVITCARSKGRSTRPSSSAASGSRTASAFSSPP